ncbi:MAG: HlyC/CorC family transporter [Chloroflexi bacterium]|nr:HlyC/CorC family transporter [Chloroflexota bacterium]
MLDVGGGLLAVLALVIVNGFFVAAEYSLVTIRRTRVEQLSVEGRLGAQNVADAVAHLDSYIATCQLGITVAGLALGWIGEPALAGLIEPPLGQLGGHAVAVTVTFILITVLLVVAGELAPKGFALQHTEPVALLVAGPLRAFRWFFRPAIWLLSEGGRLALRAVGVSRAAEAQSHIGAEELRLVVQASAQAGAIETGEQFLLERVLRFGELSVASVMVPRTEVVAFPVTTSIAEAVRVVGEQRHSRYPVYGKDLDEVLGVVHVRDLLLAAPSPNLRPLLRESLLIPSHVSVERLLAEMRTRRNHFAVAIDEFGGTDGIITLEDVLETIVGDLQDEFEEPERPPERGPGGRLRIDGLEPVETLGALLGTTIEAGPYNTVAGYVLDRLGRIPQPGDAVDMAGYRLHVVEMDDLRIATIDAEPLSTSDAAAPLGRAPGAPLPLRCSDHEPVRDD